MGIPDINYPWSTHQPLIRLLLKVFNPGFVMELGMGFYSTPLFLAHKCEKLFVENDKDWIRQMNIKENVIYHEVVIPNQDIPVHLLTREQKQVIIKDYEELKGRIKPAFCKLLFVDNYSCCRALAINTLYPEFDLIIYHDCEPQSIARNNYFFDGEIATKFDHYNLVTPATWAGCFVRKSLNNGNLFEEIKPIIEAYQKQYNVEGVYLKQINA